MRPFLLEKVRRDWTTSSPSLELKSVRIPKLQMVIHWAHEQLQFFFFFKNKQQTKTIQMLKKQIKLLNREDFGLKTKKP